MRILAETIREAHAGALRAQSLLAEAEGMMVEEKKQRGGGAKSVVRFPKMPIRRLPSRGRGSGTLVADAPGTTSVKVVAEISQGEPVVELKGDSAAIPSSLIEKGEIVFRVRGDKLRHEGMEDGDLLVVQLRPKGRAATGELVIGKIGEEV